jgi:hypothetical protein
MSKLSNLKSLYKSAPSVKRGWVGPQDWAALDKELVLAAYESLPSFLYIAEQAHNRVSCICAKGEKKHSFECNRFFALLEGLTKDA